MRQKKETLIVTFSTTTQAMQMEKLCREKGLPGRLIPVPREITAGCGLAWKAEPDEMDKLKEIMKETELSWEAMALLKL
jgi:hypothetical protein